MEGLPDSEIKLAGTPVTSHQIVTINVESQVLQCVWSEKLGSHFPTSDDDSVIIDFKCRLSITVAVHFHAEWVFYLGMEGSLNCDRFEVDGGWCWVGYGRIEFVPCTVCSVNKVNFSYTNYSLRFFKA